MIYVWTDYSPYEMNYVENWLDEKARKLTGMDDGWALEYEYWTNAAGSTPKADRMTLGTDYWNKVFFKDSVPIGAIEISKNKGNFHVMEIVVAPEFRGKGYGTEAIAEFLKEGEQLFGEEIKKSTAIVFKNNQASLKVFEKAGYHR